MDGRVDVTCSVKGRMGGREGVDWMDWDRWWALMVMVINIQGL